MSQTLADAARGADQEVPLLELRDVSVNYGKLTAVRSAGLTVAPGQTVVLLGGNSAGKTSLLTCIAMARREANLQGEFRFDGEDLRGWSTRKRRIAGIRFVPDFRGVFPNLGVRDNVRAATDAFGLSFAEAWSACEERFPEVFVDRSDSKAGHLSGGEQQMLGLSRALAGAPRLVLLDEPRLGLAHGVVKRLTEALQAASATGVSLLIADQSIGSWIDVVDTVYSISRGQITSVTRFDRGPSSIEQRREFEVRQEELLAQDDEAFR